MEDNEAMPVYYNTIWWPKLCGNATEDNAFWVCMLNVTVGYIHSTVVAGCACNLILPIRVVKSDYLLTDLFNFLPYQGDRLYAHLCMHNQVLLYGVVS
jgi:hypothetical protein